MQEWKSKALQLLPEIKQEILEADCPMTLWIEINFAFENAYREPVNCDFIRRVYEFESWSLEQQGGDDAGEHLPTCVAVAFWEHIPTNKASRLDMPRWFSLEDVLANQHFFAYHLSAGNFEDLVDIYSRTTLKLER